VVKSDLEKRNTPGVGFEQIGFEFEKSICMISIGKCILKMVGKYVQIKPLIKRRINIEIKLNQE